MKVQEKDRMEKFLFPVVAVDNVDGDEVEESEPSKKFKRMMEKKMEGKKSQWHHNQSTTNESW